MKTLAQKLQYLEFELMMCKHSAEMLQEIVNKARNCGLRLPKTKSIIQRKKARIRRLNALTESLINH